MSQGTCSKGVGVSQTETLCESAAEWDMVAGTTLALTDRWALGGQRHPAYLGIPCGVGYVGHGQGEICLEEAGQATEEPDALALQGPPHHHQPIHCHRAN